MVALTPRFTLLATFCSLAAISLSPVYVNAAVIQARHLDSTSSSKHAAPPPPSSSASKKPVRQQTPLLPLPMNAIKKAGNAKAKAKSPSKDKGDQTEHKSKKSHKARIAEWDPLNPVHRDVSLGIFDSSYKYKRHIDSDDLDVELSPLLDVQVAKRHHHQAYFRHHDAEAIVDGGHSHVHASRDHDHDHHHHHDDHDHDVHEKIIVEGKDAHVHVHRRSSSLAIPNNHGGSYVVSQLHSRRSPHHRHHAHHDHDEYEKVIIKGKDDHVHIHRDAHVSIQKRDQNGVPGTVGIMSQVADSPDGTRIGSLFLDTSNATYVLNASDKNQTQLYLVAAQSPSSAPPNSTCVFLQIPLFDPTLPGIVEYCATFDPHPLSAEPLKVKPCVNGNGTTEQESQVFSYDEKTGAVRPMWFEGQGSGGASSESVDGSTGDEDAGNDGGDEEDPNTPETEGVASVTNASANLGARDDGDGQAQNVTLVFRPSGPEVATAADVDDSTNSTTTETATTGTATGTTTTSTATETTTTTVTNTGVGGSSSVIGSASVSAAGVETTESASSSTLLDLSGSSSSASTSTSVGALNVEVFGPSSPVTDTATASSSAGVPTFTSGSDVSATSVDAEAVASSIAAGHGASNSGSSSVATSTSTSPTGGAVGSAASAAAMNVEASGSKRRSMMPMGTEPYEWMFKADSRL